MASIGWLTLVLMEYKENAEFRENATVPYLQV